MSQIICEAPTVRNMFNLDENAFPIIDEEKCYRCQRTWSECTGTVDPKMLEMAMQGRAWSYANAGAYPLEVIYSRLGLDVLGIPDQVDLCNACSIAFMVELNQRLADSGLPKFPPFMQPMIFHLVNPARRYSDLIASVKAEATYSANNSTYILESAVGARLLRQHGGKGGDFIASNVESAGEMSSWTIMLEGPAMTTKPVLGNIPLGSFEVRQYDLGTSKTMPPFVLRSNTICQIPVRAGSGEWTVVRGTLPDVMPTLDLVRDVLNSIYPTGQGDLGCDADLIDATLSTDYSDSPEQVAEAIRALRKLPGHARPLQSILRKRHLRRLAKEVQSELERDPTGANLDERNIVGGAPLPYSLNVKHLRKVGYTDAEIREMSEYAARALNEGRFCRIPAPTHDNGKFRVSYTTVAEIAEKLRPGSWIRVEDKEQIPELFAVMFNDPVMREWMKAR